MPEVMFKPEVISEVKEGMAESGLLGVLGCVEFTDCPTVPTMINTQLLIIHDGEPEDLIAEAKGYCLAMLDIDDAEFNIVELSV